MRKLWTPIFTVFCLNAAFLFSGNLSLASGDEDYIPEEYDSIDATKNELPEGMGALLELGNLAYLEEGLNTLPPAAPPLNFPLIAAITRGNLEFVRGAIQQTPGYIYANDQLHQTPLHFAAGCGNIAITEFLIAQGALLNARSVYGQTPLSFAAVGGYPDIVQIFLEHGVDPCEVDNTDNTALERARMRLESLDRDLLNIQRETINSPEIALADLENQQRIEATILRVNNVIDMLQEAMRRQTQEIEIHGNNYTPIVEPLFGEDPTFPFHARPPLPFPTLEGMDNQPTRERDNPGTHNQGARMGSFFSSSTHFPFL